MSLEGVSSEPRQSTAIDPPPPLNIGDLPQELRNQIFGNLGLLDLQAVACVSRGMNRSVIAAAHFHEPHSIKKFIRSLVQKLPEQKERLVEIARNINFQDCANLQQLKKSILDVKAQLMGVIKTVDAETEKGLHDVRPPHFLEDIFTLAAFERQIDEAHLIPNDYLREEAFVRISEALTRAGDIDRAVAVATSISEGFVPLRYMFRGIFKALREAGDIDRSLKIATSIPNEHMRDDAFCHISTALAQAGNIERALEVATSIPNEYMRWEAFRSISNVLIRAGNIDRSIAVAGLIPPHDWNRGWALRDISKALTRADHMDRAIAVAKSISDSWVREKALQDISHALTRKGDMARAQAIAKLISGEDTRRGFAFGDMCSLQ